MAKCFWTDLVGVEQESCGDEPLSDLFAASPNMDASRGCYQSYLSLILATYDNAMLYNNDGDIGERDVAESFQWMRCVGGEIFVSNEDNMGCDFYSVLPDNSTVMAHTSTTFPTDFVKRFESTNGLTKFADVLPFDLSPDFDAEDGSGPWQFWKDGGAELCVQMLGAGGAVARLELESDRGNFEAWVQTNGCY